jgi:hypothetical protein
MSTELTVIPPAVKSAVVPKPTRAEVIKAMAIRAHAKESELAKKADEDRKVALGKSAVALAKCFGAIVLKYADAGCVSTNRKYDKKLGKYTTVEEVYLRLTVPASEFPSELLASRAKAEDMPRIVTPELKDIERQIRDSLTDSIESRVQRLLANTKARDAIDKMLAELDGDGA